MLSAAGRLQRVRITGYRKTREETPEAGADRRGAPVLANGNLITSGDPSNMSEYTAAVESALAGAHRLPASDRILRGGPP